MRVAVLSIVTDTFRHGKEKMRPSRQPHFKDRFEYREESWGLAVTKTPVRKNS